MLDCFIVIAVLLAFISMLKKKSVGLLGHSKSLVVLGSLHLWKEKQDISVTTLTIQQQAMYGILEASVKHGDKDV